VQYSEYSTANPPPSPPQSDVLRINASGTEIALRRWDGNGPPLLLIHGIGSSSASWESLAPALTRAFTPIAIDLRGHGDSAKPESGYLYDDYIADIDAVINALGMDRPLVIGHSLGGILALWWAAHHPGRAAALIVVDSPLRSGQAFMPAFDQWLQWNAMAPNDLAAIYLQEHPDWSPETARRRAQVMTSTARGVFEELRADSLAHDGVDRIAELTGITSPILFIHGDPAAGSQVHPNDLASLVERLPNVTIAGIEGAGHALHRERPEEFIDLAIPFLRDHTGT
jgi:pimeloyl-ACP methyl ester carboxylesterase